MGLDSGVFRHYRTSGADVQPAAREMSVDMASSANVPAAQTMNGGVQIKATEVLHNRSSNANDSGIIEMEALGGKSTAPQALAPTAAPVPGEVESMIPTATDLPPSADNRLALRSSPLVEELEKKTTSREPAELPAFGVVLPNASARDDPITVAGALGSLPGSFEDQPTSPGFSEGDSGSFTGRLLNRELTPRRYKPGREITSALDNAEPRVTVKGNVNIGFRDDEPDELPMSGVQHPTSLVHPASPWKRSVRND